MFAAIQAKPIVYHTNVLSELVDTRSNDVTFSVNLIVMLKYKRNIPRPDLLRQYHGVLVNCQLGLKYENG